MISETYERALTFAREDEAKGGAPIDPKLVINRARIYFDFLCSDMRDAAGGIAHPPTSGVPAAA